jgi:mono/diheme cytochrome c family protein
MSKCLLPTLALPIGFALAIISCNSQPDEASLARGKDLFTKHCISCHELQDDGIGPPLGGVTSVVTEQQLVSFIKRPSKYIDSEDVRLSLLKQKYKLVMPPFEWLPEEDISAIVAYLKQQTELFDIPPLDLAQQSKEAGLSGQLVSKPQPSGISIELEEVVQLPALGESSDLGVVTLRSSPVGDGAIFVSDQHGVIYRIKDRKAAVFMDLRNELPDFQSGPGIATGLGSFDFHPDFQSNGLLYISHAEAYKGQPADYVISDTVRSVAQWIVGEWEADNPMDTVFSGSYRELLRVHAPTFAHGMQDVGFIPGLDKTHPDYGLLYFGYGDGGSNNIHHPELGHNPQSFLGSIMRIDPAGSNSKNGKYGIPAGNPFSKDTGDGVVREIYAYGFRNPHRMAWDEANNYRLFVTDIGEANIEELNIVIAGGDYGWPVREGNFGINTIKDLKAVYEVSATDQLLYKGPFAQYDHETGNAISGGYVYRGNLEALKEKYVFGDIVNGKLFFVNVNPQLSDSTVYQLSVAKNGKETTMQELTGIKRQHLRIGYDHIQKEMYIITKADGKIWEIVKAY